MMGSIFAGTDESPGKNLRLTEKFIKITEVWDPLDDVHRIGK